MGFFSKIFKGVKKVFKKIGKGIKSAFAKVGKFMGYFCRELEGCLVSGQLLRWDHLVL